MFIGIVPRIQLNRLEIDKMAKLPMKSRHIADKSDFNRMGNQLRMKS